MSNFILAGDPKQLGPIIRSPVALEYGLDVSLIERLIHERLQGLNNENPSLLDMLKVGIVHLVDNYRAHHKIMNIYSEIFYEGRLNSKVDENELFKWDMLNNPNTPVLFKHINGLEKRDQDSPSWYNDSEIDHVKEITLDLVRKNLASPKDIGIITPYRKQCDKIKRLFYGMNFGFKDIKIGTTELFQGDERKVIILSCKDLKLNIWDMIVSLI